MMAAEINLKSRLENERGTKTTTTTNIMISKNFEFYI